MSKSLYMQMFDILRGSVRDYQIKNIIFPLITIHYMIEKSIIHGLSTKEKYGYYLSPEYKFSHQSPRDARGFISQIIGDFQQQIDINIDTSTIDSLNDYVLSALIREIGLIEFGEGDGGELFTELINHISSWEGKEAGEYYTPSSIVKVIDALIDTKNTKHVYDPTMGIGSLLQSIKRICPDSKLYGQEINAMTFLYAQLYSIVSDSFLDTHIALGDTLCDPKHINQKFDLIVSNSPAGVKIDYHTINHRFDLISKSGDIAFVQHALSQLSDDGTYIAVVPNGLLFRGGEEKHYREQLLNSGVIKCVIGFPSGLFASTSIPFSIVIFDRKQQHKQVLMIDATDMFEESKKFQKILSENHINTIVDAYYNATDTTGVSKYISIENIISNNSNLLVSYYIDKFALQFQNITSNFPSYKTTTLGALIIDDPKKATGNEEGGVYLLSKGRICVIKLYSKEDILSEEGNDDITLFKNYLHISFKADTIFHDYYNYYISSEMGKISLDELNRRSAGIISMYKYADNITHLKSLKVIYPTTNEQIVIIQAHNDLGKVISSINQIQKDLAINPTTASQATEQSYKILQALEELTDADKILNLIRKGEGTNIEFKESLHYNERAKKQKDEDLVTTAFKNIVAFLNTGGGNLLIGVHDNGTLIGIEKDLKQYENLDKFLLYVKDKLINRIGKQYLQYIKYKLVDIDGKTILQFDCNQSEAACYLDDKSFYYKANPSAEELSGRALEDYIKTHFKNSN